MRLDHLITTFKRPTCVTVLVEDISTVVCRSLSGVRTLRRCLRGAGYDVIRPAFNTKFLYPIPDVYIKGQATPHAIMLYVVLMGCHDPYEVISFLSAH
jgi:hypothetical protein